MWERVAAERMERIGRILRKVRESILFRRNACFPISLLSQMEGTSWSFNRGILSAPTKYREMDAH